MSKYMNFDRCVVCRSRANLKLYCRADGPFEVTMLLNSLYLTAMHYIEKRKRIINNDERRIPVDNSIARWLEENKNVFTGKNDFKPADILRNLRNGLAHFNMKDFESDGHIREIIIWSHKCYREGDDEKPIEFKQFDYGEGETQIEKVVCVFAFSVEQLGAFAEMLMDEVLSETPDDCCKDCPYYLKETPYVNSDS